MLQFYKLREQPFGATPDPRFFYPFAAHREALASLICGIDYRVGFAALIAEPGMGKTTVLFDVLQRYSQRAPAAFIFNTQCTAPALLNQIAEDLHIATDDKDPARQHDQLKSFVAAHGVSQPVLIVIDEAQNLHDDALEAVRLLSDFETSQTKLLHIILAGQPQLANKLQKPSLVQLMQRITMFARLERLTPEEVGQYVRHRLKVAGCTAEIFTPDALAKIAERSGGNPREINRLCFNSLLLGTATQRRTIDAATVDEVIHDLDLARPRVPSDRPRVVPIAEPTLSRPPAAPQVKETAPKRPAAAQYRTATPPRPGPAAPQFRVPAPQRAAPPARMAPSAGAANRVWHDPATPPSYPVQGNTAQVAPTTAPAPAARTATALPRLGTPPVTERPAKPRPTRDKDELLPFGVPVDRRGLLVGVLAAALIAGGVWYWVGTPARQTKPQPSSVTVQESSTPSAQADTSQPAIVAPPGTSATQPTPGRGAKARSSGRTAASPPRSRSSYARSPADEQPAVTVIHRTPTPAPTTSNEPVTSSQPTTSGQPTTSSEPASSPQGPSSSQSASSGAAASTESTMPATADLKPPAAPAQPDSHPPAALSDTAPSTPATDTADATPTAPAPEAVHNSGPKPILTPRPEYPASAKGSGVQGEVTMSVNIGSDGRVTSVTPIKGPSVLARAAVAAVRNWRFQPASIGDNKVPAQTTVTVRFRLADGR